MKKMVYVMVFLFCISGSGFSTYAHGKVLSPQPVSEVEMLELEGAEQSSIPLVANVAAGDDSNANDIALGVFVALVAFTGVALAVVDAQSEE